MAVAIQLTVPVRIACPKAGASIYNPPQRQGPGEGHIMDERLAHDPIITRFRAALDDIYGARLERVVLFGSRARGEARPRRGASGFRL